MRSAEEWADKYIAELKAAWPGTWGDIESEGSGRYIRGALVLLGREMQRDAIEAAAKAICRGCECDAPIQMVDGDAIHPNLFCACEAQAIRALLNKEPKR